MLSVIKERWKHICALSIIGVLVAIIEFICFLIRDVNKYILIQMYCQFIETQPFIH